MVASAALFFPLKIRSSLGRIYFSSISRHLGWKGLKTEDCTACQLAIAFGERDARVGQVDELAQQADRVHRRVTVRHGPFFRAKRVEPIYIGDPGLPDQVLHSNRRTSRREGDRTGHDSQNGRRSLTVVPVLSGWRAASRSTATPRWVGERATASGSPVTNYTASVSTTRS